MHIKRVPKTNKKDRHILIEEFMNLGYEPFNEVWYNYSRELRNEFSAKEVLSYNSVVPIHNKKYKAYQNLTNAIKDLLIDTLEYVKVSYKEISKELIDEFDTKYTKIFFRNETITKKNIKYFRDKYLDYVSRGIAGVLILVMVEDFDKVGKIDFIIEDEMVMQLLGIMDTFITGLEDDYTYVETVLTPMIGGIYNTIKYEESLMEDINIIKDYVNRYFGIKSSISGLVNVTYNKNALDDLQDFRYEFIIFNLTYY